MTGSIFNTTLNDPATEMRNIEDIPGTRAAIFDNVLKAASNLPAIQNQKYQLRLRDVGYEGPDCYSKQEEKKAILEGRTLSRKLRGTWDLFDPAAGKVVDSRRLTLANIPYLTDRGTYIFRGNDYTLAKQQRLRPGIFTRRKESGELESHVNVARGFGHHYYLDPASSKFKAKFSQAMIPVAPILKLLGATDAQMREAWGNDIYAANATEHDEPAVRKLLLKLTKGRPSDKSPQELAQAAFDIMELDPEVTKRTLGKPHTKMSVEAILDATKKLIAVNRGEADTDDRDAPAYQRVVGPEDIFPERLHKGMGDARKILWRASLKGNLEHALPGVFDKAVRGALLETGLGNAAEEVNASELLDQWHRVTRLGEGGIESSEAIPEDSRMVQPRQIGYIDLLHSPESGAIGVDGRISIYTKKGKDGRLYARYLDRNNKRVWKSAQDVADSVVAFPGEINSKEPYVRALVKDKAQYVPREKVDYFLSHMTESFGPLANLIPMKASSFPQRISMGARMITQALPTVNPEAPFVQSGIPGSDKSFEELYGDNMGVARSDIAGSVVSVTPDAIKIRGADRRLHTVELYNQTPYNRKSFIHNTPTVKPGDQVKPGDLLATSNQTDDKGTLALGHNARVAFTSWYGRNYEDGIVISDAYAKRSASVHAYQHTLDLDDDVRAAKNMYTGVFPGKLDKEALSRYDDDGVILPGQEVSMDDPLVLAIRQRKVGPRLGRRKFSWADASVTWKHHAPGIVTDVYKGKDGINVVVKAEQITAVGDKISGRYGNKGIVSTVVPVDQMPKDKDGKPYDVLLNPLGIISRGNVSQAYETWLGKIAEKTGKPYKIVDFDDDGDTRAFVEQELKKNGLSSQETIYDPTSNRPIPGVLTGNMYLMKLHHTSESKAAGRATEGYSAEELPTKGGPTGAKRIGGLETFALGSHGAFANLADVAGVRGQKNEEYWRLVMSGKTPPEPKVPFVNRKFYNMLTAAGLNPIRRGTRTSIMSLTNKDIDEKVGNRKLQNSQTVDWRVDRLTPIPGGLFDERLTGGHGSEGRWAYIGLHEPMINPLMEEPARRLLGMTEDKFREVLAGKAPLSDDPSKAKQTGPKAIADALAALDVDKELEKARAEMAGSRKTYRDAALRRIRYLKSAKEMGQEPKDWIWTKVPVLPPAFRPISLLGTTGTPMVADANVLYKELMEANDMLKDMSGKVDNVGDERLATYDALKAVVGMGDPIRPETKQQEVRGIIKHITGVGPKWGLVQRKLLGKAVDLVGRGTVVPDPDLSMDSIGIPIDKAWEVYRPYIIRRLVRKGMPPYQASEMVKDRSKPALSALMDEIEVRPVIVNRAPTLHRYGIMAFRPVLVSDSSIHTSPAVNAGFNLDHDGDAMQFHVPATDEAVKEAYDRLLPSKNILAVKNFKVHQIPTMEFAGGLYMGTARKNTKKPVRYFGSKADVIAAYKRGEISSDQQVVVVNS